MNRVVVTGMGVISSLGNDIDTFWNNIKNGKSGINFIKSFNVENYDTKFAAYVNDINYKNISKKDIIFDSRFMTFARLASREAYENSKLNINKIDKDSFGICISNSMGGVEKIVKGYDELKEKGPSRISPMLLIEMLPNMASSKVAIDLGANGSNIPVVSSCAGGANAIGEGYIKIKNGYEKIMLVGASDASIQPLTIALFQAMKVMYRGENIDEASIPFDKRRSGFVIGEGAGIIILEELEHAKERNAKIYAEVVGYGSNCDAYSLSSPDYDKLVLKKSMQKALNDAKISEDEISYINAHGTSTKLNDKTEAKAINEIFISKPYVSSTKSMTGHLLSASGAIEAIITIKSLEENIIPPIINYKKFDEECDLNLIVNKKKEVENMRYAMTNSFGFGGHNVSLIFRKWE